MPEWIEIEKLTLSEINPREIKTPAFERLKKSLNTENGKRFFYVRPCLANKREGKLVVYGGNMRTRAAKELGWQTVPCEVDTLTIEEEKERTIKDNLSVGDWDIDLLANNFDVDDLVSWGFDEKLLEVNTEEEEQEVPTPPKEARAKRGMIYLLGRHKLMCGDSTDAGEVFILMDGKKASMVFTDPPYGVSYEKKARNILGRKSENAQIQNDELSPDELGDFVLKAFKNINDSLDDGGKYYICSPQGGELGLMMMMMMMMKAGIECRHMIVWKKDSPVFSMGRLDYDYQHEPILYGWKGSHKHYAVGKYNTSIWEIDRPKQSKLHPTMKPVEVVENAILNSSLAGEIILDLFLGSGTTLIASEIQNRICFGMEIDPIYVDVIIKRFCNHTGANEDEIFASAVKRIG